MPKQDISAIARAHQAHRSSFSPLIDDNLLGLTDDEKTVAEEENKAEIRDLSAIAALKDHPGYQRLRDSRVETIRLYRSGEYLLEAAKDSQTDNDTLGELVRVGLIVADVLEKELNTVEAAAEAVAEEAETTRGRHGGTRRTQPEGN